MLQVGLQPDIACEPESTVSEFFVSGNRAAEDLAQDPCILLATSKLHDVVHGR